MASVLWAGLRPAPLNSAAAMLLIISNLAWLNKGSSVANRAEVQTADICDEPGAKFPHGERDTLSKLPAESQFLFHHGILEIPIRYPALQTIARAAGDNLSLERTTATVIWYQIPASKAQSRPTAGPSASNF